MQHIRIGESINALIEIPFTTVLAANLQSRILGSTLANASIVVKIKQGGVTTAVTGTGTFTPVDDTNAPGVRGYRPAAGDLVAGISTFIFTGTNMEPREVPVMITAEDPYRPCYFGTAITGVLSTVSFSSDRVETTQDAWRNCMIEFLTGPNAGNVEKVSGYNGSTKVFTLAAALPATPTNGDKFRIITR